MPMPTGNNQSFLDPTANNQRNNITQALMNTASPPPQAQMPGMAPAMPGGAMAPLQPPQMPPPGMPVPQMPGMAPAGAPPMGAPTPGMPPPTPPLSPGMPPIPPQPGMPQR